MIERRRTLVAPTFWEFAQAFPVTGGRTRGGLTYAPGDQRLPSGPMARHLGPRLAPEVVADTEAVAYLEPAEAEAAKVVRAWTIDSLVGVSIHAATRDDLVSAVAATLADHLGPYAWAPDPHLLLVVDKYGFIHVNAPAPPDETTGQPMAIELCAAQVKPFDLPTSRVAWLEATRRGRVPDGPYEFRVEVATYANMTLLGALMPFYA